MLLLMFIKVGPIEIVISYILTQFLMSAKNAVLHRHADLDAIPRTLGFRGCGIFEKTKFCQV